MSACYCGSGRPFAECCGPILGGESPAPTAEALMRARYSAFGAGEADFLHSSLHPEHRHDHDQAATRRWVKNAQWLGLEIIRVEAGGSEDTEGTVEFTATYKERGLVKPHHEISRFSRVDGQWYYVDGELVKPATEQRQRPKVGRNEPCPCGSGRKYKKCCGR